MNLRGIQTIVGLVIIFVLMVGIFCNSQSFNKLWNRHFVKDKFRMRGSNGGGEDSSDSSNVSLDGVEHHRKTSTLKSSAKATADAEQQPPVHMHTIKSTLLKQLRRFFAFFDAKNLSYAILFILTMALVFVQVLFAHNIIRFEYVEQLKKQRMAKDMCLALTKYYMFEDLVYLPFSLLFLLMLYSSLRSRRFNKYIMFKFKNYFRSAFYTKIQRERKATRDKLMLERELIMKRKRCGECRLLSYKCLTQRVCSYFCCLFCCSCCVPPGSDTRCFLWYCCCLGWHQTDFYKIVRAVRTCLYYVGYVLLCVPVWRGLWNLTKKRRMEDLKRQQQQDEKIKKKKSVDVDSSSSSESSNATEVREQLDEFDIEDYDQHSQSFARNQCPFPSTPFSTSNRGQSAAVYIIYTYDVINIFMTVYTGYITPIHLPIFGDLQTAGVLVILVIQFLQVNIH